MDVETIAGKLGERDREVLDDLAYACADSMKWHEKGFSTGRDPGFARPMDCGGSNSSDHSYRLSKLVKMGLAESKQRWGVRWGRRGSKIYRPSELGLAVRAHLSKEPNH